MDAKALIETVKNETANNWENSDLYDSVENLLEKIAAHYEHCEECRDAFDAMGYEEETLKEMEIRFFQNPNLSDWICEEVA